VKREQTVKEKKEFQVEKKEDDQGFFCCFSISYSTQTSAAVFICTPQWII